MPVKEVVEGLARQGLRQFRRSRTAAKAISFDDYVTGLNPKTIKNLNLSQTSRKGDLSPEQVQLMRDEWARDKSKGMDFLDEYEEGTLDGNWHNFRGHLSKASQDQANDAAIIRFKNGQNVELGRGSTGDYQTQKLFEEDTTRTINQEITGKGRSKEEISRFHETKKAQEAIGSHHHIDDLKFIGNALNRQDKPEILQHIEELRPGTEFGDRKAGLVGAMDQKTTGFRASARGDIAKQIDDFDKLPKDKQIRLLNDLQKEIDETGDDLLEPGEGLFKVNKQYDLKTPASGDVKKAKLVKRKKADFGKATDPESYGLPRGEKTYRGKGKNARQKGWKVADKWPDGRPVTTDDLRSAYHNRLKRLNIDRKKIKYDPSKTILPKDHIEIIHYAGYNSPEFKVKREIEALMESGEWLKKPPREAAKMIVEVMDTHRMIVMNVSLDRLRMIKKAIRSKESKSVAEVILAEPRNIRRWVEENLQEAANVGWKKKIPTFTELTKRPELKPGELEEVNTVFATELASIPEKILSDIQ